MPTTRVLGARRAGVPSPEGNPKIREIYGRGTAMLPQKIHGLLGNQTLLPIAAWSTIRLRININKAGVLNVVLADGRGVVVGPLVRALQTLTFTGQPLNTETVTLDTKVYTFQTALTDVDGNVLIGASAEASIENLVAAIMLDETPAGVGAGTAYAASMTLHPTAIAVKGSATTLVATAKSGGTSGNSIVTTETLTNASWGAGTMAGGVAGDVTIDETAIVANTPLLVEIPGIYEASPEHIGEPYLMVDVAGLNGAADVVAFDAMGASW